MAVRILPDPSELLHGHFGPGGDVWEVRTPGRVNLIGEHIDYHLLPVMPMALKRGIHIAFRRREDNLIRAVSGDGYPHREFEWVDPLTPAAPGDWVNYLMAAAQAVAGKWGRGTGVDAAVVSDLPAAAGLSSSSALLVAFTLGLLRANGINATFEELMQVLPEGEYFVGTRGGGMDHAAVLASRQGCASLIGFAPLSVQRVPVPGDWGFVIAHCLVRAEKSGAMKEKYNSRRVAGQAAITKLGFASFAEASGAGVEADTRLLTDDERDAYLHVVGEARRVQAAHEALRNTEIDRFGELLNESHKSLRDKLRVSCDALDQLVAAAREAGALGARLTGAGFGGCVVVLCRAGEAGQVMANLRENFYAGRPEFREEMHLMLAESGSGSLPE